MNPGSAVRRRHAGCIDALEEPTFTLLFAHTRAVTATDCEDGSPSATQSAECVFPAPLCCQDAGSRWLAVLVFLTGLGAGSVVGAGPGSG